MTDETKRTREQWERDLRGFLDARQADQTIPEPPKALTAAVRRVRRRTSRKPLVHA